MGNVIVEMQVALFIDTLAKPRMLLYLLDRIPFPGIRVKNESDQLFCRLGYTLILSRVLILPDLNIQKYLIWV